MNILRTKAGLLIIISIFLILGGQAYAKSVWVHGNSAIVQGDPANYICFGWGMDMTQDMGFSDWVHFSIPAKKAKSIVVQLYTESSDTKITVVDVYNGAVKVNTILVDWHTEGYLLIKKANLGGNFAFPQGLGISLKIESGTDAAASHRIVIGGAGAE